MKKQGEENVEISFPKLVGRKSDLLVVIIISFLTLNLFTNAQNVTRPAVWGIARMTYYVNDFGVAKAYYGNYLGFEQAFTYQSEVGKVPQIKILVGADSIVGSAPKPYIRNQGGASHFLQRFVLMPHNSFNKVDAMRFSLQHQNPLICGNVRGGGVFPESNYSLIKIDNPNVILWALKPAEEGFEKKGLQPGSGI